MADLPEPVYIGGLATAFRTLRDTELRAAENELQDSRLFKATAATWINNPAYDLTARQALAQLLNLPAPRDGT